MGNPPFRPVKEIERAVSDGDLRMAVAVARDFAAQHNRPIPLPVAATLLPLVARDSPGEYDAYATRWLSRWLAETPTATIEMAAEIASVLADLPVEPSGLEVLTAC